MTLLTNCCQRIPALLTPRSTSSYMLMGSGSIINETLLLLLLFSISGPQTENCSITNFNSPGMWDDTSCDFVPYPYVCEMPASKIFFAHIIHICEILWSSYISVLASSVLGKYLHIPLNYKFWINFWYHLHALALPFKGSNHEIMVAEFVTQSKPVWVEA